MDDLIYLQKFYDNIATQLKLKKKFKNGSVLISLLNNKSNECYKILSAAALKRIYIPKENFDLLLSKGFIRNTDIAECYTITAIGVWYYECERKILNDQILIENIDKKNFSLFQKTGNISEKEKVILTFLILVRSFSAQCCLDLKRDREVHARLEILVNEIYEFLISHNIITKLKKEDLLVFGGSESPVYFLLRHTDALLKKTQGIFLTKGNQKYYLDIFDGKSLSVERLSLLFSMIFQKEMTLSCKDQFIAKVKEIAFSYSIYLYDISSIHFASPEYDRQITDNIETFFASNFKWNEVDKGD